MKFKKASWKRWQVGKEKKPTPAHPHDDFESTTGETSIPASEDCFEHESKLVSESPSRIFKISPGSSKFQRERKKANLRALCGVAEISGLQDPLDVLVGYEKENPLTFFLSSSLGLVSCASIVLAVVLRRSWFLHCITVFLVGTIMDTGSKWTLSLCASREFRQFFQLLYWYIHFSLGQVEKAIEGDSLRQFLASFSLKMWNYVGRSYFMYLWRAQYKRVNSAMLQEHHAVLSGAQAMHKKMVENTEKLRKKISGGTKRMRADVARSTNKLRNRRG